MNQANASMVPLQTVADYLWNPQDYNAEQSLRRAVTDQYGQDAPELLGLFLKTYGDYWWDENIFRPLFVAERRAINTDEIEGRLAQLDASLDSLRKQRRFEKLLPELSPFPGRTRERLALVRVDPAFRHPSNQELQWDPDSDVLYATRLRAPAAIDGDFAKWQSAPFYTLDRAEQIAAGSRLWRGPAHFSCRFALGWDDDYLYVGVDVTDPQLYQPFSGRGIDKGDVLTLTLETAFRKNFESTQADGDEYRLLFSPGNFSQVPPSIFSDEDYLPPRPQPRDYAREIRTAWKKTAAGFSADIAFPVAWFEGG
jgi:hypothetical protein